MDFRGKRVLVLDGYGRQIPSIVQQLYDLGCIITTLNCSKLDVGYTSHYPKYRIVAPETRNNNVALKSVLDREIMSGKYDVVFPMLEPSTEVLLSNANQYEKYVKIIAASYEAFERAYDKQETMRICMENGIPCPITKMDDESMDEYLSKVNFPLAIKPRKGTGSIGFRKINNINELKLLIERGDLIISEYVIQEYIPQTDSQYGAYLMLDKKHDTKSALVVDKIRWYPIDGGAGCFIKTIDRPDIIDYSKKLLEKLNWSSFGHVGFIDDPRDGLPKVMEINGRIPASIKICKYAGIDIVRQLLESAFEEDIQEHYNEIPVGLGLRYFQTDLLWFIQSPNRWKTKPAWFDNRKTKDYIFSVRDPLPFFSYTVNHILSFNEDMKKRSRKI